MRFSHAGDDTADASVSRPQTWEQPLKLGLEGLHSARRGDYRVIYRIDGQQRLVTVRAIEHRSDIYRPRF